MRKTALRYELLGDEFRKRGDFEGAVRAFIQAQGQLEIRSKRFLTDCKRISSKVLHMREAILIREGVEHSARKKGRAKNISTVGAKEGHKD